MSKNIRFDLYIENKLRQEFFSTYMPMNKPVHEIIKMFIEDEEWNVITQDEGQMEEKLKSWAILYKENNLKKRMPNYVALKNDMKKLLVQYGTGNNDAKGVFVSRLIEQGINEEEAYKITNIILKELEKGQIEL